MPADRLLNTVLQLYRTVHDDGKTDQIVGSTTSLLTTLSNPLNVSLLTSQLLTAPAIWHRREGLRTSLRILSIYNTAAIRVRDHDLDATKPQRGRLRAEDWARAVAKGADDRSSRWQHLLVLTGVLMGMEGNDRYALSRGLRNTLEEAVVTAANLALERTALDGPLAAASTILSLNYAFPLLSDFHRSLINCDALLPLAVQTMIGEEGFQQGNFLPLIDNDIRQIGPQLHWSPALPAFQMLQALGAKPLMASLGPLSRLAAFAVEHASNPMAIIETHKMLSSFSGTMLHQWRMNRLSGLETSEEPARLTPDALQATTPALWQVLQKALYATVTILQAMVARSLLDGRLRSDEVAPAMARETLRTLRNLFFIGGRNDNNAFQAYSFTYLTSLDVLSRYPGACVEFLSSMKPLSPGALPGNPFYNPVDRSLDLFYLNVAEHLPLKMPTEACDELIVQPATAYLSQGGPVSPLTVQLFESAHSATLSVLACPQNSELTINVVPFYVDTLFASFPSQISTRQFRVAFRTVMQIVSPPFPISAAEPHLSETLLEMIRFRALTADPMPLPPKTGSAEEASGQQPMSEQSSLVITLVDALPFLPLPLVELWLDITAQTMNSIADPALREPVKERFLEVLVSGEMDVERAAMGVTWWGTKGGKALVLGIGHVLGGEAMMSGALVSDERTSKL